MLSDGFDLLLEGVNVSYTYLPDFYDRTVTTLKEKWINAFEHIRNGTIGARW